MSNIKNKFKFYEAGLSWSEVSDIQQFTESMTRKLEFERAMIDALLMTGTGIGERTSRKYPLGTLSGSCLNWILFKDEVGYGIWKYPVPTNYEHNGSNKLWKEGVDELTYEYMGESTDESLTAFNEVFLSGSSGRSDDTTEAGTELGTQFDLMTDINDYLYVGYSSKFNGADFEFYEDGVNYSLSAEMYVSGGAWRTGSLIKEDHTKNFMRSGRIIFNAIDNADWGTSGGNYYIRIKTTTTPEKVAQAYHIMPNDSVATMLSRSSDDIHHNNHAWCYYSGSVYATILNKGNPHYNGKHHILSGSSQKTREAFFSFYNKYYLNYLKEPATYVRHINGGSIQSEINKIKDSSADKRYLLYIYPKEDGYNEQLTICNKSYISLRGVDRDSCVVWIGSGSHPHTTAGSGGTLRIAPDEDYNNKWTSNISVESLTIENRMHGDADELYGGNPPEGALYVGQEDLRGSDYKYWDNVTIKNCRIIGHHDGLQVFGSKCTVDVPHLYVFDNIIQSTHDPFTIKGFMGVMSARNHIINRLSFYSGESLWKGTCIHFNNSGVGSEGFNSGSYFISVDDVLEYEPTVDLKVSGKTGDLPQRIMGVILCYYGTYHQKYIRFYNTTINADIDFKDMHEMASGCVFAAVNFRQEYYYNFDMYNPTINIQVSVDEKNPYEIYGIHLEGDGSQPSFDFYPPRFYSPCINITNDSARSGAWLSNERPYDVEIYGNLATNESTSRFTDTGKVIFKDRSQGGDALTHGTGTLSAGTLTVNTTAVTTNSIIRVTPQSSPSGRLYEDKSSRVVGTSFVVKSTNAGDTCNFAWTLED